jgi:hypothetical protein
MKKNITAAMFAAAVAITAGAASAQTTQLRADIPFAFHAGKSTLPAGRYLFRQDSTTAGSRIYRIGLEKGGQGVMLMPNSPIVETGGVKPPRVVFECGPEECALSQVWAGSDTGYRFVHQLSPREKEYKKVAILLTSGNAN